MERNEAVDALVKKAQELRLEMKISNEGVLPADILLVLAWEEAIIRRYASDTNKAPTEVRRKIEDAKNRCGGYSGYKPGTEGWERYVNRIVKGDLNPPVVIGMTCDLCHGNREVMSLLDNMAGARPFWTYFVDGINFARHT